MKHLFRAIAILAATAVIHVGHPGIASLIILVVSLSILVDPRP